MRFKQSAPWDGQARPTLPAEMESATPARPPSFVADVLVPLMQAAITGGLLSGLLTFLVLQLTDYPGNPVAFWGGWALLFTTVAWVLLLADTRKLLWAVERLTGQDLNGDQQVGRPKERLVVVNAARARQEAEARAAAARRSEFVRFVTALPVRGTSLRAWEREIGREAYAHYRDTLIRLGWARWNSIRSDGRPNERQGWRLTADPAEIVRRIGE